MQNFVQRSIKWKINLMVIIIVFLALFASTVISINRESKTLYNELEDKGRMTATPFAGISVEGIKKGNYDFLRKSYKDLMQSDSEIRYIVLVDNTGKAIVHSNLEREGRIFNDSVGIKAATSEISLAQLYKQDTGEILYDISVPVSVDGKHWGAVRLGIPVEVLNKAQATARNSAIAVAIIVIILSIILTLVVVKSIIHPVNQVVEKAKLVSLGDFTQTIDVRTNDEIGLMANAFNEMVGNIKNLINEVKNTTGQVTDTSLRLSKNSDESAKVVSQVASAIQEVAMGNTEQSKNVMETVKIINQLGDAVGHIASGAQEQATSVNLVSRTVGEMALSIEAVATNAQQILNATMQTSEVAKNGSQAVLDTVTGMGKIKDKVYETAEKIKELGDHSQQIGEIIEVIDDIAEQTNLLALNAAIEAARAGEHGKGFAVVADEVRKLAERSGKATKEIAVLITNIQKGTERAVVAMEEGTREVEAGVRLATGAGTALDEILRNVNEALNQVRNISAEAQNAAISSTEVVQSIENVAAITEENTAATEQMAAGSDQAVSAITQISAVSEKSAAAAEQVSASTEEMTATIEEIALSAKALTKMSGTLNSLVEKFSV
ncbi:MAG: methyl-accepting chemotaxis protein [Eubacteriales bacterium]